MTCARPEPEVRTDPGIAVRIASGSEAELRARTAAQGWSDSVDLGDVLQDLMLIAASRESGLPFLVERNGDAIAAGTLYIWRAKLRYWQARPP